MTIHRPAPSRAVVDQRREEVHVIAQAEVEGAHIHIADLWRDPEGVLTVQGRVAASDWLDGLARGLDTRRW